MENNTTLPGCGPVAYAPHDRVPGNRREAEAVLTRIPGVQGVGEGQDALGGPAWIAYVRDSSVAGQLPANVSGRSVLAQVSGEIDILPA